MKDLYSILNIKKSELEKIVLCDLQIRIYPELEKKFLTILREAGLPNLKFGNNSKISSNSVLNKDVKNNVLAHGNPAKINKIYLKS